MRREVKPYESTGSKKEQVSKMFDNIAPRYDFLNRLLSLGIDQAWRRKAINQLPTNDTSHLLDVATGTADLAVEMIRQGKAGTVIGVDIANEMLDIGRKKLKARKLDGRIELQYGDSENLPFDSNTFDGMAVAFGVRNYENLHKGLAEMNRVLKEGATMVVLEFSKPRMFPFKQIYNAYFQYVLPIVGKITSKDPKAYRYLYESVQAFPEREQFLEELIRTGFSGGRFISLTLGICCIYVAKKQTK
ncbi:MAG: bifunctional demethylmenaquinone methyltransferase/2-methoxy-6-polyprenyl-1,4-benzoquinol methylase UbiE [Saprospirales bacterium]|nr:bifunctional demethylmenaquinone methyltransferase/2-methoxy-6-polyprenyl-1,4-benzoquinol methylase UbiE [Saprospirales bacterium]MBK8492138.1 bifunctional demethylmenaquinone methyltransferase/2-methoxy-6-polyprenyl-1,4-benzoquinol methylase UbiE [Saprospirales bacterium]